MSFKSVLLVYLSTTLSLWANDTTVTVAAGGIITPKKEKDISIKKELLTISPDNIKVEYEFINKGPTKTVTVAFPLPKSPYSLEDAYPHASWDEAEIAYRTIYGDMDEEHTSLKDQLRHNPILDFKLTINGVHHHTRTIMRAYNMDGKDITDLLKQHNIPLSSAYLRGFMEQPPMDKFPHLKGKIADLNLADKEGYPNWQLQITHLRDQTFKANETTYVTHTYTPYTGSYFIKLDDFVSHKDKNTLVVTYHGSKETRMELPHCSYDKDRFKALIEKWGNSAENNGRNQPHKSLLEVQYILTTGANWNGPIESFRLTIVPRHPKDVIIVKGKHPFVQNDDGSITITYNNYIPMEELTVWFIPY